MQHLEFTLENDGSANYLIYLSNKLDIEVNEKLYDSFSATTTRKLYTNRTTKAANKMIISEYICSKINDVLDTYWDIEKYGIPLVTIVGDTSNLDMGFRNKKILMYTLGCNKYNNPELWINGINEEFKWPDDKNLVFLSRYGGTEDNYSVIATSAEFAIAWLSKVNCTTNVVADSPEARLTRIMHNWYKDEEYNNLVTLSERAISDFVVLGKINIYIPGYLTIPSYHIKRYKKALDLINSIYNPEFVMTIPIYRGNTSYTVLFPICDSITADTVRR